MFYHNYYVEYSKTGFSIHLPKFKPKLDSKLGINKILLSKLVAWDQNFTTYIETKNMTDLKSWHI